MLGLHASCACGAADTCWCTGDLLESLPDSLLQAVQESIAVAEHAPSLASRAAAAAAQRLAQQHKRPAAGQGSFRPSAHLTDPQGVRSQVSASCTSRMAADMCPQQTAIGMPLVLESAMPLQLTPSAKEACATVSCSLCMSLSSFKNHSALMCRRLSSASQIARNAAIHGWS